MEIKVNYVELKSLGENLVNKAGEIFTIRDNIVLINDQIRNSWIGMDATMFLSRGESYIKQLEAIQEQINNAGAFINETISGYQEIETKYESLVGEV